MVDEVNIMTKFTRGIVSKFASMVVKKKCGYDINIQLNEFQAVIENEKAKVHLNLDAELTKDELSKLMKMIKI